MATLTDLMAVQRERAEAAAAATAVSGRARQLRLAAELDARLEAWGLPALLGLERAVIDGSGVVAARGAVWCGEMALSVSAHSVGDDVGLVMRPPEEEAPTCVECTLLGRWDAERAHEEIASRAAWLLSEAARHRQWRWVHEERERVLAEESAAKLAQGRRGAEALQAAAAAYLTVVAEHNEAAEAWAEREAARLWRPWSGWRVRYTPVGGCLREGNGGDGDVSIQEAVILDDLADVVTESPGAAVRRVMVDGQVKNLVIGAFLDAEPVEFEEHKRVMAYQRTFTALRVNGPSGVYETLCVHVPPAVKEEPAPSPKLTPWEGFVAARHPGVDVSCVRDTWPYWLQDKTVDELANDSRIQMLGAALEAAL